MMLRDMRDDALFEKLTKDILPNTFSEAHLDIRDHLGDGIYLLKDCDLGVCYSFRGLYDEPLTTEELKDRLSSFFNAIRSVICGIPSGDDLGNIVIQVICSQRRAEHKNYTSSDRFSNSTTGRILSAEEGVLFEHLHLTQREYFLSVRFKPTNKESKKISLKDIVNLKCFRKPSIEQSNEFLEEIERNKRLFNTELSLFEAQFDSDFELTRVSTERLVRYYQNVLHFGKESPVFSSETNIHDQVYNPSLVDDGKGLSIKDSDNNLRVFYLEQLPNEYAAGHLRSFMDAIALDNWDLVWVFADGKKDIGSDLNAKQGFLERKYKTNPLAEEFQNFRSRVSRMLPYGRQSIRLITYNTNEQEEGRVQSEALNYIGARMILERQIPIHMLATSLPLNCTRVGHRVKGRQRTIRFENALFFLPIYGGPSSKKGMIWRIARDRSPIRFDLFAGEANKFALLLAESRAGKSVITNQLVMEFLERFPDGICRVIDKQTSYLKLSDVLDGRVVKFSEEELKEKSYSPFALSDWDMDDIESIFILITTVIHQKNPEIQWSGLHDEVLREAIKKAFNVHAKNIENLQRKGKETAPHPIWSDILAQLPEAANSLAESGVRGADGPSDDISKWTVNLYETGQYGFLFSAYEKGAPESDNRFLVYDLDGIPDLVLRQIAAMIAFGKIVRDLAKLPLSTPKLVILEEFGMLIHGDDKVQKSNTAFIKNLVKICAKLNCMVISITNNVDDFAVKEAGKVMWENSTQKIFLSLGSLYENAKKAWQDEFSVAEWQILKSLRKERQYFRSSCYIRSFNDTAPWQGSFYIPLTPQMDALCTTSASQVELYRNLRIQGLAAVESLEKMAQEHPYGEGINTKKR